MILPSVERRQYLLHQLESDHAGEYIESSLSPETCSGDNEEQPTEEEALIWALKVGFRGGSVRATLPAQSGKLRLAVVSSSY